MSRFTVPRDVFFGHGSIDEIRHLKGYKRAFVVADHIMEQLGIVEKLTEVLRDCNMEDIEYFFDVEAEPSVETVMKGAARLLERESDIIFAIGGGSVIDAAKAMWIFYEHPELTFDRIIQSGEFPQLREKAILVAIPSTSGTGSEVTSFAVITDHQSKVKYPIADFEITPDVAILDSQITATMPPKLVAYTGMDALTHGIEAYVAKNRSSFTRPLSIHSIAIIIGYLEDSYYGDIEAKDEIHVASCLAGMAFTNAQLGINHSIAHKAGALFGVPHGLCNSILLPYVIDYNRRDHTALRRYARIAKRIGFEGDRDKLLLNSLLQTIATLTQNLNLPTSFEEAGVNEFKYNMYKREIAENAFLDPCTLSNPRETNPDDLERILECAYYGKKVAF